jgi:hypothetical protein
MNTPRAANQAVARRRTAAAVSLAFVVVDLGVDDPGVVVRDAVHVPGSEVWFIALVAQDSRARGSVPISLMTAHVAPAAPVGDVPELLHIDVDKGSGVIVLVAADHLTGAPIDVGQPVDPAADQHRVHRGGRHVEPPADLDRAEAFLPPQVHDLADHWLRCASRAVMRAAGPVGHRRARRHLPGGFELGAVAVRPALRGRPGHPEVLSNLHYWPAVLDDESTDPNTLNRRQSSISVGHEDLLVVERFLRQLHSTSGGLRLSLDQMISSHLINQRPWAVHLGRLRVPHVAR